MQASKILGVGKYLPERVVTNNDLAGMMETSDEWIQQRSGIQQRRWATPEETTSDLALKAAEEAIRNADIPKDQIDMIIFATLSPDFFFPGCACVLQSKLGLPTIAALDVRQQCSGFIYALSVADAYIRAGLMRTILVVGAEIHSKGLDKTSRGRDVSVLFGDGAGAVVVGASDCKDPKRDSHILSTTLHAEGQHAKELWVKAPGMDHGADFLTTQDCELGDIFPKMNGKKVYVHAVKRMCEVIHEGLAKSKLQLSDVDLFLFHQANLRINEAVGQELKIPAEKVFNTIQKYGNTTAATIPIGMCDAQQAGVLKPGMLVALTAFGSGFTWGNVLLRF